MRAREPLISPIVLSDLEFPLEYIIIVCEALIFGICESLSPSLHDFLNVDFDFDEAILESMTTDSQSWEEMHHRFLFLLKLEKL